MYEQRIIHALGHALLGLRLGFCDNGHFFASLSLLATTETLFRGHSAHGHVIA